MKVSTTQPPDQKKQISSTRGKTMPCDTAKEQLETKCLKEEDEEEFD